MRLIDTDNKTLRQWEAEWSVGPSRLTPERPQGMELRYQAIQHDAQTIGMLVLGRVKDSPTVRIIVDIVIDPRHRGNGYARETIKLVCQNARHDGIHIVRASVDPKQPAQRALSAPFRVQSRHLKLAITDPYQPDPAAHRLTHDEFAHWRSLMIDDYAAVLATNFDTPREEAVTQVIKLINILLGDGPETTGHELWKLTVNGKPCAYIWLHIRTDEDELYIQDVFVEEEHRGHGLGRRLMNHAAHRAAALNVGYLRLHVYTDNPAANRLYEALGYAEDRLHVINRVSEPTS